MKRYILTEAQLAKLLRDEIELAALECSGVDNWGFFGEHWEEYFRYPDVDYPEDWDVEDKIEDEITQTLEQYEVV